MLKVKMRGHRHIPVMVILHEEHIAKIYFVDIQEDLDSLETGDIYDIVDEWYQDQDFASEAHHLIGDPRHNFELCVTRVP